jgi:hypothetical protein
MFLIRLVFVSHSSCQCLQFLSCAAWTAIQISALRDECRKLSPILFNKLDPAEQPLPYAKTIFLSAVNSLKSADVLGFQLRVVGGTAFSAAYIHSKMKGSIWYLSTVEILVNNPSFFPLKPSCSCVASTRACCCHITDHISFPSIFC